MGLEQEAAKNFVRGGFQPRKMVNNYDSIAKASRGSDKSRLFIIEGERSTPSPHRELVLLTLRASAAAASLASRVASLVRRFLRSVSGTAICCAGVSTVSARA